ncbi:BrnA antitoxin family protein [Agrobacterium sp. BA1120]|uniref:BrnA antitoxin family protein n=1 Tax=Agrobacterium sp. BA1120 TaxID=3228927 RepID=UPI000DE0BAF3
MAQKPRRPLDPRDAAEALFAAPKKAAAPAVEKRAIPTTKELVSLKIDSDVLAYFQEDGPGWQERINDCLRIQMLARRDSED